MIDGIPVTGPSIFQKDIIVSRHKPTICGCFLPPISGVFRGSSPPISGPKKRRGCAHRLLRLWRRRCFVGARGDTEKGLAAAWVLNGVNGVLYGVY